MGPGPLFSWFPLRSCLRARKHRAAADQKALPKSGTKADFPEFLWHGLFFGVSCEYVRRCCPAAAFGTTIVPEAGVAQSRAVLHHRTIITHHVLDHSTVLRGERLQTCVWGLRERERERGVGCVRRGYLGGACTQHYRTTPGKRQLQAMTGIMHACAGRSSTAGW